MQADNNKYRPDKQFTDRSWAEMQRLLDKEMPVEKRKRRGFFWVFLILGLGMVSAIWAFYPKKSQDIIVEQSQQIFANKTPIKNSISEKPEIVLKVEDTNLSNKKNDTYRKNKSNKTKPIVRKNNPIQKSELIFTSEPIAKVETLEPLPISEMTTSIEYETLPTAIDQLFSLLEIEESGKEISTLKFYKEEDNPKISFGAFGGALVDLSNTNEIGGFIGLRVHFPLNEKFGIRTGIGYSFIKKNQTFNFLGNQDASVRDDFSFINPDVEALSVSSSTNFVLKKMHYLDLPILLTFTPHRKVQFQLGAQGSYLRKDKVKSVENNLSLLQPVDPQTIPTTAYSLSTVDLSTVSFRQYADENFWNRFDVSSVIGVGWKPTKWLNIELQYHRGWLEYLKTNQEGYFVENDQDSDSNSYSVSNSAIGAPATVSEFIQTKNINHSIRLGIGIDF